MTSIDNALLEVRNPPPRKYFLFYEWDGLTRREIYAKSLEKAIEQAETIIKNSESQDEPIKWAYLVMADEGRLIRNKEGKKCWSKL